METKICTKCGVEKPITDFYKRKGYKKHYIKDGYRAECKNCDGKLSHEYKVKHSEEIKRYNKETHRRYYTKNKDKILEKEKKYVERNKEKKRVYYRMYRKRVRETNICVRIKDSLRARLRKVLKGKNKSKRTEVLVGCSIEELKNYIEKRFEDGMSWCNYGKWHIDHIVPCNSFDLIKESEQRKCFHFSNLQPLWAKDNIRKG